MSIPTNIRNLRVALQLSKTEFARALGLAYFTVHCYEKSVMQPGYPTARKMVELAKKNGIKVKLEDLRDVD